MDADRARWCLLWKAVPITTQLPTTTIGIKDGAWDALHVVEALPDGRGATTYKLSSSVLLSWAASETSAGGMDVSVSGSVSRRVGSYVWPYGFFFRRMCCRLIKSSDRMTGTRLRLS